MRFNLFLSPWHLLLPIMAGALTLAEARQALKDELAREESTAP